MRLLHVLDTPWAPYSVMFSNDGTRLGAGGGAWYGEGGILLARLATGESAVTPMVAPRGTENAGRSPPTVAGIYFSADDRYLVAATRGSSLSRGPTLLFAVSDLSLERRAAYMPHDGLRSPWATGVLLFAESAIVRHNASRVEDCISVRGYSPRHALRADDRRHPLTHSQMVVRRGRVLTGGGGSLKLLEWRRDSGIHETGRATEGLVSAPLIGDEGIDVIPVRACRRVTAIAAMPGEDGFLTGGLDGEIDRWLWAETPRQERLAPPRGPLASIGADVATPPEVHEAVAKLAWATYTRDSIVGLCTLCDDERWISVDAGGRLRLWRGTSELGGWTLPVPGTPRSLAAHPYEPWVAVGIKQGGFGHPNSVVLVLEC